MSSVALDPPVAELAQAGCVWTGAAGADLEKVLSDVVISVRAQRRVRTTTDESLTLGGRDVTLAYVAQGELGTVAPDGCVLSRGGVLLLSGDTRHRMRTSAGSRIAITELRLVGDGVRLADLLPEVAWVCGFDRLEPAAAALVEHLDRTAETGDAVRSGDRAIGRMLSTVLLQSAIRAWALGCAPAGWPARSDDPFLARAIDAIHAEPDRAWTIDQLAGISAMSRSRFAERFRAAVDCSPAGYVALVRMRAARDMLSRGEGVSAVAHALGYGSDEGFSRAFRRHHGVTPSVWRSEHPSEAVNAG
ncbi:AraC family transcriptional regulator [Microbacterium sp.]|uniref:helix-turn-helix transcriptional regulator n=1 Tax=Microbacterium sp. TaxID=51671 RepID=UPI00281209F1|nr:AraC family transcriptional regulator [Microbacterium sp.]